MISNFLRRFRYFLSTLMILPGLLSCAVSPALLEANLSGEPVRIGSYNIFADFAGDSWSRRRDKVLTFARTSEFDILALQEVTEVQLKDLATELPGLTYIAGARSDGHRDDQGWYEFNPIFFAPDRYVLLDWSSFWVSETPFVPGSILPGTKQHARVLTWAKLHERSTERDILVVNVHIHGLRAKREIEIISSEIARLDHQGPIVLLGDFNMTPDEEAYRMLLTGGFGFNFSDAFTISETVSGPLDSTVIGPDGATYERDGHMRMIRDVKRIDYIFICGARSVAGFETQTNRLNAAPLIYASDHYAIAAQADLSGNCKPLQAFGPA